MEKRRIDLKQHLYWLQKADFEWAKELLSREGFRLTATLLTPCQVLKASGRKVVYAPPEVWSRICVRQGSWYRDSRRSGQYMLMSEGKLPEALDPFLDSTMSGSDFLPEQLPSQQQLKEIVDSKEYQQGKPTEWEGIGIKDAMMFKVLFTLTRFWKKKDNLKKFWLSQRANHANFLSHKVTTDIDGERVPYSVTENAGVCSSCAEFFNIISDDSRKLVSACPGAVIFGKAQRDVYYDIQPIKPRTFEQADPGESGASI